MKIYLFLNCRKGRSPAKIDHFMKKEEVAHENRPVFEF